MKEPRNIRGRTSARTGRKGETRVSMLLKTPTVAFRCQQVSAAPADASSVGGFGHLDNVEVNAAAAGAAHGPVFGTRASGDNAQHCQPAFALRAGRSRGRSSLRL